MSSDTAGSPAPRRRGADSGALEGAPQRSYRDPIIAIHRGRGDGSVIEFRSVVDAVRCAIEVQSAMVERNASMRRGASSNPTSPSTPSHDQTLPRRRAERQRRLSRAARAHHRRDAARRRAGGMSATHRIPSPVCAGEGGAERRMGCGKPGCDDEVCGDGLQAIRRGGSGSYPIRPSATPGQAGSSPGQALPS